MSLAIEPMFSICTTDGLATQELDQLLFALNRIREIIVHLVTSENVSSVFPNPPVQIS